MLGGRRLSGTRLAWEGTWRVFRTDHPLVFSFFQSEMSQDSLKDAGYDQVVEVNEAILSAVPTYYFPTSHVWCFLPQLSLSKGNAAICTWELYDVLMCLTSWG